MSHSITPEQAEQIAAMLCDGQTQGAIMAALGVSRQNVATVRRRHGIIPPDRSDTAVYGTIATKWQTLTADAGDGHTRWTGPTTNGTTPCLWWGSRMLSARAVAYEIRTSRPPVGRVQAECEQPWCVAPAHVEDQPGRDRIRQQLGALTGVGAGAAAVCGRGHDQAVHGARTAALRPYCRACRTHIDHTRRTAEDAA